MYPHLVPEGLAALVQHGVPVDRFPLYTHQEEALLTAFGNHPNLLVATGTGSGKTEGAGEFPRLFQFLIGSRRFTPALLPSLCSYSFLPSS